MGYFSSFEALAVSSHGLLKKLAIMIHDHQFTPAFTLTKLESHSILATSNDISRRRYSLSAPCDHTNTPSHRGISNFSQSCDFNNHLDFRQSLQFRWSARSRRSCSSDGHHRIHILARSRQFVTFTFFHEFTWSIEVHQTTTRIVLICA